mgnify:CR=1 FL=1
MQRIRTSLGWLPLATGLVAVTICAATPGPAWSQEEPTAEESVAEVKATEETATAWTDMSLEEKVDALAASSIVLDDDGAISAGGLFADVNVLWTCLAAFLVFFMQAGFAMVETGFTRAKSACNIMMKNLMDFSIGSLAFWMVGFGLMFGAPYTGLFGGAGIFGTSNFFFEGVESFDWAFLLFQTVFAATAATIVSGAMAERTKFTGYLAYSVFITVLVYPIFGSWAWNGLYSSGGWLEGIGFYDFAGSTVVHSVGGWAALAGAIVLGPRLGKYVGGKTVPIPGHNIPIGALGVFILWLGWFGFNAGSTTQVNGGGLAFIAANTNIAAAAGAIGAMITAWLLFKKPDPSLALNGALAGLVTITAGCDTIPVPYTALCGLLGGALVVLSVIFFDRIRVDDPVGAISVHGVCGAWGTICVGLFGAETGLLLGYGSSQLIAQLIGVGAAFAWAFPVSLGLFLAVKYTIGLRVSEEEELQGVDIIEHGMYAYPPGFVADTPTGTAGTHLPTMPAGVPSPAVSPATTTATGSA